MDPVKLLVSGLKAIGKAAKWPFTGWSCEMQSFINIVLIPISCIMGLLVIAGVSINHIAMSRQIGGTTTHILHSFMSRAITRPDSKVQARFRELYQDGIITMGEYKELESLNDEEESVENIKQYSLDKFR